MKAFNASDMAHKRTEIFKAARGDGAILQKKNTNGEVLEEFVMVPIMRGYDPREALDSDMDSYCKEIIDVNFVKPVESL